ncbi:MAG: hypothetical protein RXR43_16190, partial [Sulfolobus sp.]
RLDFSRWFTYFYVMLSRGVIPMGGFNEQWTVSIKHTEEDILRHIEAAEEAIKRAKSEGTKISIEESF